MQVPDDVMERIYATLQYYASEATYHGGRISGVLAGCQRGPKPTLQELTFEARQMVKQIDEAQKMPNAESSGAPKS